MNSRRKLWEQNVYILLVTIGTVFALYYTFIYSYSETLFENYKKILHQNALIVRKTIESKLEHPDEIKSFCNSLHDNHIRITVILKDGTVLGDNKADHADVNTHADRPEVKAALKGQISFEKRFSETLKSRVLYVAVPIKRGDEIVGVIRNSASISDIERDVNRLYIDVLLVTVLIAGVALFLILRLSQKLSRSLDEILLCAERFSKGVFSKKINPPNIVELDDLASSLNKMANQLDEKILFITQQKMEQDTLLSSMAECVVAVDMSGKVLNVNDAFLQTFMIQVDCEGQYLESIVRNSDLNEYMSAVLTSEEKVEETMIYLIKQDLYLKANGSRLVDAMGEAYGAVVVLSDLTKIKRLEKIRQDFVANASHEIRTPITSIKGFVETILMHDPIDLDEARHFLQIILKQSDRLNEIINDLLLISSLEEAGGNFVLEVGPLHVVIRSSVQLCQMQANEKDIEISVNCDDKLETKINPHLLEQALVNLIINAIKYSPEKSKVMISAEVNDSMIELKVSDNGPGIASQHFERLFERFYRVDKARSRKLGGTGLGLSIVKHVAQIHHGNVAVTSQLNHGSTFIIYLPLQQQQS